MSELTQLGAFELAAKIKNFEVSPTEVVSAHIDRIQEKNPSINAVVEERFDQARKEAQSITPDQIRTSQAPLLGVPFTVKEMIAIEGMKSTMGSRLRANRYMRETAPVVQRMLDAGSILLGTTNVPELGFWFESSNPVYGKTSNPHNHTHSAGGSSGGEAAIIAVGGSPFGIGSDIGGSLRIPAAFCGVYGHCPSEYTVPLTGHLPLYRENAKEIVGNKRPFSTLGPMSRRAKDLRPLLEMMMGPDGYDSAVVSHALAAPEKNLSHLKIFTLENPQIHAASSTEKELQASVAHATRALAEFGATTAALEQDVFLSALELWSARLQQIDGPTLNELVQPNGEINFAFEFFNVLRGAPRFSVNVLLAAALEKKSFDSNSKNSNEVLKRADQLSALKNHLTQMLQNNGVIIMPVHPRVAPKHMSTLQTPFDFAYTALFNALGFPATSIPMGKSESGLPLSVQVIAAWGQDHLCLSVAEALEDIFGGWVQC